MSGSVKGTYLQLLTAYTCLYALCLVGAVALSYFGILNLPQPGVALVLALLPLLYHLILFRVVVSQAGRRAAYMLGIALVCIPIIFVSLTTGGYSSPNTIAFVGLVFLSAMLGPEIPMALIWVQIIGYILGLGGFVTGLHSTPVGALFVVLCIVAGMTGWAVFRRYRVQEDPVVDRLRRTLHEEQLQSEALIAAISDGIAIVNKEGVVIHANDRFLDMVALKTHEIVGKYYKDVVSTNVRIVSSSVTSPRIGPNITKVLETGESVAIDSETIEYLDGRPSMDLSLSIAPLKNDDGDVSAVMIVSRDITHIMQLQRMKDALIMTASHELRTPVTVIAGYADLLLGESAGKLTDKQRHYLDRTKETTTHLTEMINDMLDVSRLESGQRENNPEEIDLVSFLQNITEEQLARFANKQISLRLETAPNKIMADKGRLRQVVGNLLNNAYIFAPEGGEVLISSTAQGSMTEVAVKDNGPGVPNEHKKTIFDKFSKLDTTGSLPGAGLGLAIAKTIVEAWGGTIAVRDVSPHGAEFFFTVPTVQKPVKNQAEHKEET